MLPFFNVTVIQRVKSPNNRKERSTVGFFFFSKGFKILLPFRRSNLLFNKDTSHITHLICAPFSFSSQIEKPTTISFFKEIQNISNLKLAYYDSIVLLTKMIPEVSMEQE